MRKIVLAVFTLFCFYSLHAQVKPVKKITATSKTILSKEKLVEIKTDMGTIVVKLYDSTPLHRDNFIAKVKQGFYDSLLFHRVIQDFMIQGGDPTSKNADSAVQLGNGEGPGDMIPAEFKNNLIHKKGALAMARTDNPAKASSNCQFYIVEGKPVDDNFLNQVECNARQTNPGFFYNDAERKIYKTIGGTPFLDQNYTVFGEVVKGLDVVDKIAAVSKDSNDRPLKNIRMKMRLLN